MPEEVEMCRSDAIGAKVEFDRGNRIFVIYGCCSLVRSAIVITPGEFSFVSASFDGLRFV